MSEREKLLSRVRMYDFALADVILYLDGHPKSSAALAYFRKMKDAYEKATAAYEQACGPLTAHSGDAEGGAWRWIGDPWPWEGAEN